ncbi:MAG: hypothetical protein LBB89_03320 [Treponema sp.]|nr:hypothetical protein [Treponema sp.]
MKIPAGGVDRITGGGQTSSATGLKSLPEPVEGSRDASLPDLVEGSKRRSARSAPSGWSFCKW